MKRLLLFRHSLAYKTGDKKGKLTPEGFALAIAQGEALADGNTSVDMVGYSPLSRTSQTLLAMLAARGQFPSPEAYQFISLGTEELFAEITSPRNFRVLAEEKGLLHAMRELHPTKTIQRWAKNALNGFHEMMDMMVNEETMLAVGHSPIIELGLLALDGIPDRDVLAGFSRFREMEGIEIQGDAIEVLYPKERILPPKIPGINC